MKALSFLLVALFSSTAFAGGQFVPDKVVQKKVASAKPKSDSFPKARLISYKQFMYLTPKKRQKYLDAVARAMEKFEISTHETLKRTNFAEIDRLHEEYAFGNVQQGHEMFWGLMAALFPEAKADSMDCVGKFYQYSLGSTCARSPGASGNCNFTKEFARTIDGVSYCIPKGDHANNDQQFLRNLKRDPNHDYQAYRERTTQEQQTQAARDEADRQAAQDAFTRKQAQAMRDQMKAAATARDNAQAASLAQKVKEGADAVAARRTEEMLASSRQAAADRAAERNAEANAAFKASIKPSNTDERMDAALEQSATKVADDKRAFEENQAVAAALEPAPGSPEQSTTLVRDQSVAPAATDRGIPAGWTPPKPKDDEEAAPAEVAKPPVATASASAEAAPATSAPVAAFAAPAAAIAAPAQPPAVITVAPTKTTSKSLKEASDIAKQCNYSRAKIKEYRTKYLHDVGHSEKNKDEENPGVACLVGGVPSKYIDAKNDPSAGCESTNESGLCTKEKETACQPLLYCKKKKGKDDAEPFCVKKSQRTIAQCRQEADKDENGELKRCKQNGQEISKADFDKLGGTVAGMCEKESARNLFCNECSQFVHDIEVAGGAVPKQDERTPADSATPRTNQ